MATTHYPELKGLELRLQECKMPAWNFDTASRRPTYRFMQRFLDAPMPLKLPAVWACREPLSRMP